MIKAKFDIKFNPPKIPIKKATYVWNSEYAAINHNGSFSEEIRRQPRPWVYKTISDFSVESELQKEFDRTQNITTAFKNTAIKLGEEFTNTIESPVFFYPTTTYRKNGEVVTSPRNVVDMGDLRDSLEPIQFS